MRIRPGIELANLTDVGLERDSNEDYFGYWEPENDEEFRHKGRLAVVADGMGGHEGGEEASRLAVEAVCQAYRESSADSQNALVAGFRSGHERIRQFARENSHLLGMGTTCTAFSLTANDLCYAHVGDSRLYLIRGGVLTQLTNDHSRVMDMVHAGILLPPDAEGHPDRNVLTRALGVGDELQAEIPQQAIPLQCGDTLLLCTDGLWSLVGDQQLLEVLQNYSPTDACKELVRRSKACGAPDNITLQVLKMNTQPKNQPGIEVKES
jgi:serine/threonine protein phosphatase PrpC